MEEKNKNMKKENKNNPKKKTTKKVAPKNEIKEKNSKAEVIVEKNIQKQEVKKEKAIENKKEVKVTTSIVTNNEMANLVKIIIAIIAIFLIFYGITVLVTNNKDDETEMGEVIIQYDEILLGTLFKQTNSEYYVLVTKENDYYNDTYNSLLSMYSYQENSIRFYTVNLDSGFNKSYESTESNISNNLKELKLSGATLLKIKDKQIVASYEEKNEIVEHLNSLLQ